MAEVAVPVSQHEGATQHRTRECGFGPSAAARWRGRECPLWHASYRKLPLSFRPVSVGQQCSIARPSALFDAHYRAFAFYGGTCTRRDEP